MKVLVADDDPVTTLLLDSTLSQWGYDVCVAEDGEQALKALRDDPTINLVIADWSMPKTNGLELIKTLKADPNRFFYIILLTGKGGTENLVKGIDAGADDYINKPFVADELRVRVRAGARILEQERRLQFHANRDELTGVWNRRMIMSLLDNEWQRAEREKLRLILLLMDLDKFKTINDTYGHDAGDEVLKRFCQVVNSAIRPYDTLGRYGGEEFILLMPLSFDADVRIAGERIRKAVADASFIVDEDTVLPITVSIGIAEKDRPCKSVKALVTKADEAMYQAKRAGGNGVAIWNED